MPLSQKQRQNIQKLRTAMQSFAAADPSSVAPLLHARTAQIIATAAWQIQAAGALDTAESSNNLLCGTHDNEYATVIENIVYVLDAVRAIEERLLTHRATIDSLTRTDEATLDLDSQSSTSPHRTVSSSIITISSEHTSTADDVPLLQHEDTALTSAANTAQLQELLDVLAATINHCYDQLGQAIGLNTLYLGKPDAYCRAQATDIINNVTADAITNTIGQVQSLIQYLPTMLELHQDLLAATQNGSQTPSVSDAIQRTSGCLIAGWQSYTRHIEKKYCSDSSKYKYYNDDQIFFNAMQDVLKHTPTERNQIATNLLVKLFGIKLVNMIARCKNTLLCHPTLLALLPTPQTVAVCQMQQQLMRHIPQPVEIKIEPKVVEFSFDHEPSYTSARYGLCSNQMML